MSNWNNEERRREWDDLPQDRDMYLIGSDEERDLQIRWEDYLSRPDGSAVEHPNAFLNFRMCTVAHQRASSCEVNICVNQRTRWHAAVRTLHEEAFVRCVGIPNYDGRHYLIVAQSWFDELSRMTLSLYAMVDTAGMREFLGKGSLDDSMLLALESGLDAIAGKYPDYAFVTFADTVLLKSNWLAGSDEYEETYRPERFLSAVDAVAVEMKATLGLDTYAVVTQGANHVTNDPLLRSTRPNHINFGSLGAPFAELYEIEKAARKRLREKEHVASSLYLSNSLLLSLRFKSDDERDNCLRRKFRFTSSGIVEGFAYYHPVQRSEFLKFLEDS